MLPPICILAGGLGTRLGDITQHTPKPLIEVAGEPFLNHQIRALARRGANKIVLCVGYLGEQIEQRIGPSWGGVEIVYSYDSKDLDGTLGAVRRARHLLGDRFLVLYGDTYLQIDFAAFADAWVQSERLGAMSVLRNRNQWDRSNAVYRDGVVVTYDKFATSDDMEWIDYGLGALDAKTLDWVSNDVTELAYLYHELSRRGELFGFEATERFYEIGSPSALSETDAFLRTISR